MVSRESHPRVVRSNMAPTSKDRPKRDECRSTADCNDGRIHEPCQLHGTLIVDVMPLICKTALRTESYHQKGVSKN